MERLSVLEKKLIMFIEAKKRDAQQIQELELMLESYKADLEKLCEHMRAQEELMSQEIVRLSEENTQLKDALLVGKQNIEVLNQEREMTKMGLEDLIKTIEIITEEQQHEQQQ